MKYCVVKNTTKVIDGSNNPAEIMLRNAQNAGFTESEVEILTEEEYLTRKELEPPKEKEKSQLDTLQETVDMLVLDNLGVL